MKKYIVILLFILPVSVGAQVSASTTIGIDSGGGETFVSVLIDIPSPYDDFGTINITSLSTQNNYNATSTSNMCSDVFFTTDPIGGAQTSLLLNVNFDTHIDGTGTGFADCSKKSFYYVLYEHVSTGGIFYAKYYWTGTTGTAETGLIGIQRTFIEQPTEATTTATTTIDIEIFYDNSDETFDQLNYDIYSTFLQEALISTSSVEIGAGWVATEATTTSLIKGNYRLEAYLYKSGTEEKSFPIDIVNFTVLENPLLDLGGINPDDYNNSILSLATTTCSFSNLSGCFQNALVATLYPSPTSLERFGNLTDEIKQKPPFGYFVVITDVMANINSNSTPAFTLVSENNITTNIFSPLRTGMTWLLWFVFGFWLYKRVTNINI